MPASLKAFDGSGPEWNSLIQQLPSPHLLQTWEWAKFKSAYGWEPIPLASFRRDDTGQIVEAAAMLLKKQILRRGFARRLSILYVPKGPLLDWSNKALRDAVLDDLRNIAIKAGAIFIKMDPDVILGHGVPGSVEAREAENGAQIQRELRQRGWLFASDQIQFRNTVLLDLRRPDDQILAEMAQKTRYNLRLAAKRGVTVRDARREDLPRLYAMYAETSRRDGFVIRDRGYYETVWRAFMENHERGLEPAAEALIAEVEDEPVAALFLFRFARQAYYLYGMSREAHREKMPNQLLQWEAIRRAKQRGCEVYDLWGAPDEFRPGDPLWGVFRFKQGFGGELVRTLGAWDYPASSFWYQFYTGVMPRVLDLMRRRGQAKTRGDLAAA